MLVRSVRTTTNLAELQQLIFKSTILQPETIIGIDGMDGSGKSCLAAQLASLIGASHINLDDFLNENQGGFVDHIRYDDLRNVIRQAMPEGPVIIEGCCLRAVLDRVALAAGLHVYVKNFVNGYWQRGNLLEACCAVAAIAKEEEILRNFYDLSGAPFNPDEYLLSALKREIIIYHFQYRPHEHADLVYERSEHPGGPEVSGEEFTLP